MRIDFYYTAKRLNSLIRPDIDEQQTVVTTFTDFHLKDTESLNNPVFIIAAINLPETNYCILSQTGATNERPDKYYYFVDKIVQYRKTVWHIYCTIDALATWKTQIKNQQAFVVRSTNLYEPYEIDTALPTKNKVDRRRVFSYLNEAFTASVTGGTYILSICANAVNEVAPRTVGAITHLALTYSEASDLLSMFFDAGTAQQLVTSLGSPANAIVGCYWIPLKYEYVVGDTVSSIRVAGLQKFFTGKKLGNIYRLIQSNSGKVNLTHYGDFRDNAPYRSYYMKFPWYGYYELDNDVMAKINRDTGGSASIYVNAYYDFLGGILKYLVYINNVLVADIETCAKVDIPVSTFQPNVAGMVAGALSEVGKVGQATMTRAQERANLDLSGGKPWGAALQKKTAAVLDEVSIDKYAAGTFSVVGGYSGTMLGAVDSELVLYEKIQNTVVEPSSIAAISGRPFGGVASLSSISGFCLTKGFSMTGRMTSEEKSQIENAFNVSGVYDL